MMIKWFIRKWYLGGKTTEELEEELRIVEEIWQDQKRRKLK